MSREPDFDFLVVGGGPVGLHAALKAAVLNHRVLLVDKGQRFSRVGQAPAIANIPLAPGISGPELLTRLREDLRRFQDLSGKHLVTVREGTEVVAASREGDGFELRVRPTDGGDEESVTGRVLVLATGVVDRKPGIGHFWHEGHATLEPYLHRGEVGYCILCEGWSLEDEHVAVVGALPRSVEVAVDVAEQFGGRVTLLTDGERLVDAGDGGRLRDAGVRLESRVIESFEDAGGRVKVRFMEGEPATWKKVFFTLGWYKVNNELACALGARVTPEGFVVTDENSEVLDAEGAPIRGLFAVGDLRAGCWKQVVVGWGHAETAVITAYAHRLPAAERVRH